MKKLLMVCLTPLLVLVCVLVVRTFMAGGSSAHSQATNISFDADTIADHLAKAVRIKTIS